MFENDGGWHLSWRCLACKLLPPIPCAHRCFIPLLPPPLPPPLDSVVLIIVREGISLSWGRVPEDTKLVMRIPIRERRERTQWGGESRIAKGKINEGWGGGERELPVVSSFASRLNTWILIKHAHRDYREQVKVLFLLGNLRVCGYLCEAVLRRCSPSSTLPRASPSSYPRAQSRLERIKKACRKTREDIR